MESKKYSLSKEDWIKIGNNFLVFYFPVLTMYLSSIQSLISQSGHVFSWGDFIPNTFLTGMLVNQVLSTTIDIFKKWSSGLEIK